MKRYPIPVRVINAYGPYNRGYIIPAMPAAIRQEMVRRGFVEEIEAEPDATAKAPTRAKTKPADPPPTLV